MITLLLVYFSLIIIILSTCLSLKITMAVTYFSYKIIVFHWCISYWWVYR